jgi:hypothetical protein
MSSENGYIDPADYDECLCHAPRVETVETADGHTLRYCEKCGGQNP